MNEDNELKVGVEVRLKNMEVSELTILVILLEELKRKHPEVYPVAVKAIEEAENARQSRPN